MYMYVYIYRNIYRNAHIYYTYLSHVIIPKDPQNPALQNDLCPPCSLIPSPYHFIVILL